MPPRATATAPPTSTTAQRRVGHRRRTSTSARPPSGSCPPPCRAAAGAYPSELGGHVVAAAERLDQPDAAGGLLDQRGHVALLVLHLPGGGVVAAGEGLAEVEQRHRADRHQQPQRPVQVQQQRDHGDVRGDVDDQEHQAEREEAPDHARDRGWPGTAAGRTASRRGTRPAAAADARRGRCACAVSMPSAEFDCTQRRMKFEQRLDQPERQRQPAEQPQAGRRRRCATGPSTTRWASRGIAMLSPVAARPATISQMYWAAVGAQVGADPPEVA